MEIVGDPCPHPKGKCGQMQSKACRAQGAFDYMPLINNQAMVFLYSKHLAGDVTMPHVDHVGSAQELDDA